MKQTAWIDEEGYWLRDEPVEDDYNPQSSRQIDLKKTPIPNGLNYPRFIKNKWQEGSTTKPFPTTPNQLPITPNWTLLKIGLQPFYQKYATTLNLSASVAFYMSAINTEVNSPTANIEILQNNLIELVKALGIRLDAKDKSQLNQLLTQSGFNFQL
jgi:hypothetical protein